MFQQKGTHYNHTLHPSNFANDKKQKPGLGVLTHSKSESL